MRFAWSTAAGTLVLLLFIQLIVASFPAIQTRLPASLGAALQAGAESSRITVLVLLVAFVIAGFLSLQDVCSRLGDVLRLSIAWQGRKAADRKISRIPPGDLRQPDVSQRTRQALEVVSNGNLSVQTTAVTSVIFAVLVCVFLFMSLFHISVLGAVLLICSVIACLIPAGRGHLDPR